MTTPLVPLWPSLEVDNGERRVEWLEVDACVSYSFTQLDLLSNVIQQYLSTTQSDSYHIAAPLKKRYARLKHLQTHTKVTLTGTEGRNGRCTANIATGSIDLESWPGGCRRIHTSTTMALKHEQEWLYINSHNTQCSGPAKPPPIVPRVERNTYPAHNLYKNHPPDDMSVQPTIRK